MTSEDVTAAMTPFKVSLQLHRSAATKARKIAERYEATGNIADSDRVAIAAELSSAQHTSKKAMAYWECLFFERETSSDKHLKLIDDLSDVEADLEEAFSDIKLTDELISSGEFIPATPPTKKTKKKQ